MKSSFQDMQVHILALYLKFLFPLLNYFSDFFCQCIKIKDIKLK